MKHIKPLNSAGDTIIEVLIVLAVLGFAFAISTATATKGLSRSRNAEEHSQALGILGTQIELLRAASGAGVNVQPVSSFCMIDSQSIKTFGPPTYSGVPGDANTDNFLYPLECREDPYNKSITYHGGARPYYEFRVRWEGIGSLGVQQENVTYRIYPLGP